MRDRLIWAPISANGAADPIPPFDLYHYRGTTLRSALAQVSPREYDPECHH